MSDFLQLTGKSFLIFGVANRKSVAWHVAKSLVECGAKPIFVVRSEARRESLAGLLKDAPCYVCDVEHEDQIARPWPPNYRPAARSSPDCCTPSPSPTIATA